MIRYRRWSGENDVHVGPYITYCRDRTWRTLGLSLRTGDGEERKGCHLMAQGFGHTLILELPQIVEPYREKVIAQSWDAATVARLGRNWYWDFDPREFGFSLHDGLFSVRYGRQSHDSSTEKTWSWFLPWTQWRHVRRSFYDLKGDHFWTEWDRRSKPKAYADNWEISHILAKACPAAVFEIEDYDGQRILASTRI